MPVCVISTVGLSVINNRESAIKDRAKTLSSTPEEIEAIRSAKKGFPGEQEIYEPIMALLNNYSSSEGNVAGAAAELKSIIHILKGVSADNNDELHFLATNTADGVMAARVLADFCPYYFTRDTQIHVIEGLQVKDGVEFRKVGLRNFIKAVYSILNNAPAKDSNGRPFFRRILNPTGGFKGIVPYLTVIGMLETDTEVSYIYEYSEELIKLAHLPLGFDYTRLGDIQAVLNAASGHNILTEDQLRKQLKLDQSLEDHPAWALFDTTATKEGDTLYELSGLGQIALQHFTKQSLTPVYLSQAAAKRYDRTTYGSDERRNYDKILNNIHDPYMRENNHHTYPNPDNAPVYKLPRQKERAFYWDYGDYILILELTKHRTEEDYDTVPDRLKTYGQFREWKRRD